LRAGRKLLGVPVHCGLARGPRASGHPRRGEPYAVPSATASSRFKLWVFVFSAIIAGVAGALYVPQVGIINPSEFAPINSIEVVIWVASAGAERSSGRSPAPCSSNYAKTFFTGTFPEVWLYALGTLFVLANPVPAARHHRRAAAAPGGEMNAA